MSDSTVITGIHEVPVFFPAGGEQLFGVLTPPAGASRGTGVIALVGGSYIPGTNINRLSVRLARELANRGFHVLRFDYHGVGESTGTVDSYRLDTPFIADLEGATALMRKVGLERLVFIGTCFGARTLLATADRVPELCAAVLMSAPVQDLAMDDAVPLKVAREKTLVQLLRVAMHPKTLRSIFTRQTPESGRMRRMVKRTVALKAQSVLHRVVARGNGAPRQGDSISEHFITSFRRTVDRGVPLLFLYGQEEASYEEFCRSRRTSLQPLFERARAPVDVEAVDGVIHGFSTLAVQRVALERTIAWVERIVPAG